MTATHQVTCAHDWCPEWAITASWHPIGPQQLAAQHRAELAEDGWTDLEGRDYCPDHTPAAARPVEETR
ncbi:hypothetical protein AB0B42_00520 [Streptomyces fradiae]|uniref:hypothetical protein n=1 Tax=Streptomyces fradiae TaxID=1906 RepID=UPI0033F3500C